MGLIFNRSPKTKLNFAQNSALSKKTVLGKISAVKTKIQNFSPLASVKSAAGKLNKLLPEAKNPLTTHNLQNAQKSLANWAQKAYDACPFAQTARKFSGRFNFSVINPLPFKGFSLPQAVRKFPKLRRKK
jgi:hypothetical protein